MVTVREFKVRDYSWSEKTFTRVLENLPEVISRFWSFRKAKRAVSQAAKELSSFHENQRVYVDISRLLKLEKEAEGQQNVTYEEVSKRMEREKNLYKKLAEMEKKSVEEVKVRVETTFKSNGKVLTESEELQFREEKKNLNKRLEGIVYHGESPMVYDELTYFILMVRKVFRILMLVVKIPYYLIKLIMRLLQKIPPDDVKRARKKVIRYSAQMFNKPKIRKTQKIEKDLLPEEEGMIEEKELESLHQEAEQEIDELSAEEERDAEKRGNIILNGLLDKWKDRHSS